MVVIIVQKPNINEQNKKYVHIKCKLKGVSADCFRLRGTKYQNKRTGRNSW